MTDIPATASRPPASGRASVRLLVLIAVLALLGCASSTRAGAAGAAWSAPSGPYFGQRPPGMRAEMFAPGIVSSEHHDDGPPAFSADGRECFWRVMGQRDGADTRGFIFWSREVNGRWTEPRLAAFSSPDGASSVCLQADGRRLYFRSRRPHPGATAAAHSSPWFVDRTPSGWSAPRPLALSVGDRRLTIVSAGADGWLHCVREDPDGAPAGLSVYRVRRSGDGFATPEPRGVVPTSAGQPVSAPTVSPDGNTLVFTTASERRIFLMASFREPDGTWTAPQPLGDDINAPPHTKFAGYSSDGRHLFVVSNRKVPQANPPKLWGSDAFSGPQREPLCDVYWVDAKAVEALRPATGGARAR